ERATTRTGRTRNDPGPRRRGAPKRRTSEAHLSRARARSENARTLARAKGRRRPPPWPQAHAHEPADRGRACGRARGRYLRRAPRPFAQADRPETRGRGALHRLGIDLLSRAAGRGTATPSWSREGPYAAACRRTSREGPVRSVELGHHVPPRARRRHVLLPLPLRGRVEPEDRRLRGA